MEGLGPGRWRRVPDLDPVCGCRVGTFFRNAPSPHLDARRSSQSSVQSSNPLARELGAQGEDPPDRRARRAGAQAPGAGVAHERVRRAGAVARSRRQYRRRSLPAWVASRPLAASEPNRRSAGTLMSSVIETPWKPTRPRSSCGGHPRRQHGRTGAERRVDRGARHHELDSGPRPAPRRATRRCAGASRAGGARSAPPRPRRWKTVPSPGKCLRSPPPPFLETRRRRPPPSPTRGWDSRSTSARSAPGRCRAGRRRRRAPG